MTISFEIPPEIAHELRADGADLDREAKEAFLVELYRRDRIAHHQLAEALGLDRYETDGVLKRHKVSPGVSAEETRSQAAALRDANAR
jgi:predicted HTH domain antitoxin